MLLNVRYSMDALRKYLILIREHPEMFLNKNENGEIKIITDEQRINSEQKKIRARFIKEDKPACWIDIGVLAEDEWFYILRDMVEFPDGRVGGYIRWINRKSSVDGGFNVVMICVQNSQVLLIRKYRHEERDWMWEFPRGFGEPGLSPEENVIKEMKEEIGITPLRLTMLTNITEGKGGTAVFYAEISPGEVITIDIGEGLGSYRWITISQLDELVAQGKLRDWFSLWAYALVKAHNS
jgi:ADP-ribose pyrophosphatase